MTPLEGTVAAGESLARRLALPRVMWFKEVESTLDVAHDLAAAGALAGTLVVADAQTAGRGRMGRSWRSEPGAGVWLTLIERPVDIVGLEVLSLRVGLAAAPALDALAPSPIRLKWPNDLYIGSKKLAGVLIEARWREARPDWVAIGVGVNLRPPAGEPRAVGLRDHVTRGEVLDLLVPAIRRAAASVGPLTSAEISAYAGRDIAAGRPCSEPALGVVRGIDADGSLLIDVASRDGPQVIAVRAGSLVLQHGQ